MELTMEEGAELERRSATVTDQDGRD